MEDLMGTIALLGGIFLHVHDFCVDMLMSVTLCFVYQTMCAKK
jgi:hypothetical protein